jgi:hypothetical protein
MTQLEQLEQLEQAEQVGETGEEKPTAELFASLKDGRIQGLTQAIPPHELRENQIELTRVEFDLLRAIDSDIARAEKILRAIKAKIKANGN